MNISQTGINLIKGFEGCSLKAYKPTPAEPHYTIGYGHSGVDVRAGETITQAKADSLLTQDVTKFAAGAAALIKVPINQNQFDALVSFAYNVGLGNFKSSTLLSLVNKKDFKGAANEFAKWNKSGGKVLNGLVKRRAAEKSLFLKPIATKPAVKMATSNAVMWDGMELKKGQIGRLTILKPINLWKDINGKLVMVRVLQPSQVYRVYGYRDDHDGQYSLGGSCYVTKMDGYIKYETPSKKLLEKVNQ